MEKKISLDLGKSQINEESILKFQERADHIHAKLHSGKEAYTGWVDYAMELSEDLISEIEEVAADVRKECTAFVILGIGGSYLGARACIDMLGNTFHNQVKSDIQKSTMRVTT